jgi:hypothetical protein
MSIDGFSLKKAAKYETEEKKDELKKLSKKELIAKLLAAEEVIFEQTYEIERLKISLKQTEKEYNGLCDKIDDYTEMGRGIYLLIKKIHVAKTKR